MRIAIKAFRYRQEALQPLLPQLTPQWLRGLHACQDRLGRMQDLAVLEAQLENFSRRQGGVVHCRRMRVELTRERRRLGREHVRLAALIRRDIRPPVATS